eukprot:4686299-Pleurochrysis_carterae.AAC.1
MHTAEQHLSLPVTALSVSPGSESSTAHREANSGSANERRRAQSCVPFLQTRQADEGKGKKHAALNHTGGLERSRVLLA